MGFYVSETVRAVKFWLERTGLTLTGEKTKPVLIMRYRKRDTVKVEAVGHTVVSRSTIPIPRVPRVYVSIHSRCHGDFCNTITGGWWAGIQSGIAYS